MQKASFYGETSKSPKRNLCLIWVIIAVIVTASMTALLTYALKNRADLKEIQETKIACEKEKNEISTQCEKAKEDLTKKLEESQAKIEEVKPEISEEKDCSREENFLTYKDAKYGYSFRYPCDFSFTKEEKKNIGQTLTLYDAERKLFFKINTPIIETSFEGMEIAEKEDVVIPDSEEKLKKTSMYLPDGTMNMITYTWRETEEEKSGILIFSYVGTSAAKEKIKILDKIMTTFNLF